MEGRANGTLQTSRRNRKLVPHRDIVRASKAYLAQHPELREQAMARAWQLGIDSERINAVLFDRKPSGRLARPGDFGLRDLSREG